MAEIAQLMPNGEQTFVDANGVPLAGGTVGMYVPNTGNSVFKNTWQDEGETILNTNPILLDSAGRCIIYGNGKYQQLVKDRLGNVIWNQLTNWVAVPADTDVTLYDLAWLTNIKTANGETCFIYNCPRALRLPAGLTASIFTVGASALPTGATVFTLYKNAAVIGTISFATTGVVTVTFVTQVDFAAADQFSMVGPAVADATANFLAFTFVMTVP